MKTSLTRLRGWAPRGDRLVMELEPGTVVILDNLATHKNAAAAKAMRDTGCWFLFLPP